MLFISDSTRERLAEVPDDLGFVDHFEIRGRVAKMAVVLAARPRRRIPKVRLTPASAGSATRVER